MDDFNSETDSDYTSYWRDWVGGKFSSSSALAIAKSFAKLGGVSNG